MREFFFRSVSALIQKPVVRVAVGDAISKIIIVFITIFLIRRLSISEYSHFTKLFNSIFIGYQLATGPIERLFIAEHDRYKEYLLPFQMLFTSISSILVVMWIWNGASEIDILTVFLGIFILANYQVFRIKLQQNMYFFLFSGTEVVKNILWLIILMGFMKVNLTSPSESAIMALLIAALFARMGFTYVSTANSQRKHRLLFHGVATVIYGAKYVILYSVLGAVIPYIPVMLTTINNDDLITATYGAAMRYQAILGMGVYALTTVLLPKMAVCEENKQNYSQVKRMIVEHASWICITFFLVIGGIYIIIPYIDKGKYDDLQRVFLIFSLYPLFSIVSAPFINLLLIKGRSKIVFVSMFIGLLIGCLLFLFLHAFDRVYVPAISTLIIYAVIFISTAFFAKYDYSLK